MKALVIALFGLSFATAAEATTCAAKIAAAEAHYQKSQAAGIVGAGSSGSAPESTDAKLHHQPTAGSVAGAESSADSSAADRAAIFSVAIEQAKAAENSGDVSGCESAVADAEKALRP